MITLHTLTLDNDKAFARHQTVAKALNVDAYFTSPYTSQDKGTVENRIGQLRRFFPKKTDLQQISHARINQVETLLNNRPIKKYDYTTPNQVPQKNCAKSLNLPNNYLLSIAYIR